MSTTILYVDDSEINRLLFERILSRHMPEAKLLLAEDAEGARYLASSHAVDCAVVDVVLMGENGISLCNSWKNNGQPGVRFPVLLISALEADSQTRLAGLESGADDFISRPIEHVELIAKVKVMLRIKRAEDELRAVNKRLADLAGEQAEDLYTSTERYRHLFDVCSDGVLLIEVDTSAQPIRVVEANDIMCHMLGWRRDEIIKVSVQQIVPEDRIVLMQTRMQSVVAKQQVYAETELLCRDGRAIPFAVNAKAIVERGKIYLLGVFRRRTPVDDAIGSATHGYRLLADETGQIIYETDVRTLNTRQAGAVTQVTGYTPAELAEMQEGQWAQLIHDDDRNRVMLDFVAALDAVSKYQFEYRLRHKNGTYRLVEDVGVVLPDEQGRASRVVGTIKDITARHHAEEERRRAEQEMQHSQRLESLGVLAGGIAHDFNNILAGIIGMTDLTIRELPKESPLRQDLEEALRGGHRAKDLVKQILAFSRQSDEERGQVYLHIVVREALRLLRASIQSNIEIIDSVDVHSGAIIANTAQLYQVITNFCTNSAQAMPDGGKLEVKVRNIVVSDASAAMHPRLRAGNYVQLCVIDSGHGMTPAVLTRIFDPFFTTKRPGEGTGMGLAVVYGIVSSHGGYITVESQPGRGAVFETYFPQVVAMKTPDPVKPELPAVGSESVLLVDDEATVLKLASSGLPRHGYKVTTFECPAEALAYFKEHPEQFDVLVTDYMMPKMTGNQLAEAVHAIRPDLPILMFTGFSDQLTEERAAEVGIDQILLKPILTQELALGIQRVLEKRRTTSPA